MLARSCLQRHPTDAGTHLEGGNSSGDGGASGRLRRLAALEQPRDGIQQLLCLQWPHTKVSNCNTVCAYHR